ncbi:SMC domain protein [Lancefieldella parvula DSM 20469]|uniref:SMC domain protein n=1 Tax=Lancefieldella parvula (strain ATCC 33793 / DSM 20469 / CCUG 32760 / JCM 10300 / KCTC 3663 / VPI 0546 / 1246) TaxID=521095 RepID=C8W939_LANP1|nr:AAA family ATPase [Lancefieldella parvula]ACV50627.1 SMC domain protein [Lancefieldella parvula DSM 20469]
MAIAKWYKIDFHTHTPESRCFPDKSITAARWLQAAKDSGLNAVVVTDHNSVGFISEIEKVKNQFEELNPIKGNLFKVFYGIELCVSAEFTHILIIFDDKMSVTEIEDAVIGCLGLKRNDWANTEINVSEDKLKKLCQEYENKVFVIPAHFASNKGLGTCRTNAIKKYQEFVKFSAVEVRNSTDVKEYKNKLNNKVINEAVLVTGSDNPSNKDETQHSIEGFGKIFTWIKVSDLSFNALRQVFIGPEHRCINWLDLEAIGIDYNPNNISFNYISGINFKGISHMTDMNIRFSPHLNCIVGGRGTGKSTLVEAINYGVGNESDLKRCNLMEKTFDKSGSISTFFNFGEVKAYKANCIRSGKQTVLTIEDDNGVVDNPPEFKIDFYGQKEIFGLIEDDNDISSSDISPLIKLIDDKVKAELFSYKDDIENSISSMVSLSNNYKANRKKIQDMPGIKAEIEKSEAILKKFQASGIESARAEYEQTDNVIKTINEKVQTEKEVINESIQRFSELKEDLNRDILVLLEKLGSDDENIQIVTELKDINDEIINHANNKIDSLSKLEEKFNSSNIYNKLKVDYEKYKEAVEEVNNTGGENIDYIQNQLQNNRNRYDQLNQLQQQQRILKEKIRQSICDFVEKRIKLSDKRKHVILELGLDTIKIEIVPLGHISRWKANLQKEFGKEGIFDSEFEKLSENVLSKTNNFENYKKFLEFLLIDDTGDIECLYEDIKTDPRFNKLWLDKHKNDTLSSMVKIIPEDKVNIKILEDSGEIDINDGSPGQKSAALLAFILNSGDSPLVIDQPEDDLDNSLIYSLVVTSIRRMKKKRQIIIVTHNPNIPVLGDAEGILILDRDSFGKVTFRKDKKAGCIEEQVIKEGICEIMEGGEAAFKKREEKYLSLLG